MGESAEELYRRALEAADADGRLPAPPLDEWETFPFDGEIRVRPLRPPGDEPPRAGEDPDDCWRCNRGDSDALWSDERWLLTPLEKPSGLPVIVILEPRAHCDLGDLPGAARGRARAAHRPRRASGRRRRRHRARARRPLGRRQRPSPLLVPRPTGADAPAADELRRDLGRHPPAAARGALACQPRRRRTVARGRRRARARLSHRPRC